jgi:hypothetical protein
MATMRKTDPGGHGDLLELLHATEERPRLQLTRATAQEGSVWHLETLRRLGASAMKDRFPPFGPWRTGHPPE